MNYDDALEILGSARNPDVSWRNRHDDHYDQQFPGQRFPTGPPGQMSFQQVLNYFCLLQLLIKFHAMDRLLIYLLPTLTILK